MIISQILLGFFMKNYTTLDKIWSYDTYLFLAGEREIILI